MKLKELAEVLNKYVNEGKGDLIVNVSSDPEGNSVSNVDEITLGYMYDGEGVHPDDVGTEYDESEVTQEFTIWPI